MSAKLGISAAQHYRRHFLRLCCHRAARALHRAEMFVCSRPEAAEVGRRALS